MAPHEPVATCFISAFRRVGRGSHGMRFAAVHRMGGAFASAEAMLAREMRMGNALKDGYRGKVFLMTKIDGRTKESAAKQIDESLKRLQTDHVDLLQIHENIRMEDSDRVFAPGGAMEAIRAAKQAGKLRFIGFTGHKDPSIHLKMLDVAQRNDFHFDTAQMPINVLDAHYH